MLIDLIIHNLKLIKHSHVSLGQGLQVITGESGAGKSMFLSALHLITGERLKKEALSGDLETKVEAIFDISGNSQAQSMLEQLHIATDDGLLILRRHIDAQSRSKVFANGTLIPLKDLKTLAETLMDIHSQHSHQSLLDSSSHLDWIDCSNTKIQEELTLYEQAYQDYSEAVRNRDKAEKDSAMAEQELDFVRFQLQELNAIPKEPAVYQQLLEKRKQSLHAERLQELLKQTQSIWEQDDGLMDQSHKLERSLAELAKIQDCYEPLRAVIENFNLQLDEVQQNFYTHFAQSESNTDDLEQIEEQLFMIEKLLRKYNKPFEELCHLRQDLQTKLDWSEDKDYWMKELQKQVDAKESILQGAAHKLHQLRKTAAEYLEQRITDELKELGIRHALFKIDIQTGQYGPQGSDQVQFMIQTNKGRGLAPLADVASGGELSRIILALKSVLTAHQHCSTFIFDEVDANLGGETAVVVGQKLRRLAQSHQILCITHLPQIAALADRHIRVLKEDDDHQTWTKIEELNSHDRVVEIARMLGGDAQNKLAQKHAKELIAGRGGGLA